MINCVLCNEFGKEELTVRFVSGEVTRHELGNN